jgi:hypothetical protein
MYMSDHLRKRSMPVDLKQAAQIKGSQTSLLDEKLEYANPHLNVKDISPKVTLVCFKFLPSAHLDQIHFQTIPLHDVSKINFKVEGSAKNTSRLRCDMRPG